MLEVNGLTKSFGSLNVLKGVNMNVKKGEMVALMGPSGSGCLLYTSPSPRDATLSRMPSSA